MSQEEVTKEADRQYLEGIKIGSIFKELLAMLILSKPEGEAEVKKLMTTMIKSMSYQGKAEFYDDEDFDTIFQAFDPFRREEISLDSLFRILAVLRIPVEPEGLLQRQKLTKGAMVSRKAFLKLVKREYSRMVSLDPNS